MIGKPEYADLTDDEAMRLMSHCHAILDEWTSKQRPGGAGRPEAFYAHFAAAYSILVHAGSEKPVAELSEALTELHAALSK